MTSRLLTPPCAVGPAWMGRREVRALTAAVQGGDPFEGGRRQGDRDGPGGGNVCCASSSGRRGPRAQGDGEGAHGTACRRRGASSGRPRRARRETAPRGRVEKRRGGSGSGEASLAVEGGVWPAARRRRTARRRRCDREGGDGGDGNLVNKMKFKNSSL